MPKHLILFALFMALLLAIFYHPIPNPEIWDADARHVNMPKYPLLEKNTNPEILETPKVANWTQQLEDSFQKQQTIEMISALP